MDTSGVYINSTNTQRRRPQPYTALFHHLAKTLPLTPWPSAPYSISLGKYPLPLNPVLLNVTLTATQPLSITLATGACSPHLTHQFNQNATSLRWLYYYYDMATCAKVFGENRPKLSTSVVPRHICHYQAHLLHIIHTIINGTMEYTCHAPKAYSTKTHIPTHTHRMSQHRLQQHARPHNLGDLNTHTHNSLLPMVYTPPW
jgi:hypothetical protein